MSNLRKSLLRYHGKEPKTSSWSAGSWETLVHRFLLHGSTGYRVGNMADLSSLSPRESQNLNLSLSKIDIRLFLKSLLFLHINGLTVALRPLTKTIPFVLAHISKMHGLQELSYQLAEEMFKTPEQFVLFIKYVRETAPFSDDDAFADLIERYYNAKDVPTLCKMIGDNESYDGWNHRKVMDVGRLRAPPKPEERPRQALIDYARGGLDKLIACHREYQGARGMIEKFTLIESFKQTTDPQAAVNKIVYAGQSFSSANNAVLADKSVIKALLRKMSVRQVFGLIGSMDERKWFLNDSSFVNAVIHRLKSERGIIEESLHPSEPLIAQQIYVEGKKSIDSSPTGPNIGIVRALNFQIEFALKRNVKTLDISVAVFVVPYLMADCFCGETSCIPTTKAAAMIAATLKKSARTARIFTFEHSRPVELYDETFESLEDALRKKSTAEPGAGVASSIAAHATSVDLVVVIGNRLRIRNYSTLPSRAKLILTNLTTHDDNKADEENGGILLTTGFSESTCDVIAAYAALHFCKPVTPHTQGKMAYENLLVKKTLKKRKKYVGRV